MLLRSAKAVKYIKIWLWSGAALIFVMLVVGGITRLTGSGLSMTDWNIIMGTIPPLNSAEWTQAFEQYKQFPEYQQVNAGMTLAEFKNIFFWEYIHRLIGRFLGLAFLLPFTWFWYKGYFSGKMIKRLLLLFILGASQGVMGWVMVKSGLADVPYVSHFRLAVHLVLAFLLFGYCIWLALEVQWETGRDQRNKGSTGLYYKRMHLAWLYGIGILIGLQVIWGAFVAGLKAGYIYNTFPTMNGEWLPQNAWLSETFLLSILEMPGMVQWSHRLLGTILALGVILFWIRLLYDNVDHRARNWAIILLGGVLLQYLFGVITLIYNVPVVMGVLHQAMALIVWGVWIGSFHAFKEKNFLLNKTNLSEIYH